MKTSLKYIKHFLEQTIYLLPYSLMGVSFLSIAIPLLGFKFDFVTWGNGGGFSVITDIAFIYIFYFNIKYCWLTRHLPFALLFINIVNIISNEFFPQQHEIYSKWYEIIIFSVILFIAFILALNNKIQNR